VVATAAWYRLGGVHVVRALYTLFFVLDFLYLPVAMRAITWLRTDSISVAQGAAVTVPSTCYVHLLPQVPCDNEYR
jgi:hypothetical protein